MNLPLSLPRGAPSRESVAFAAYAALVVAALACGGYWLSDAFDAYAEFGRASDQQAAYQNRFSVAPVTGRSSASDGLLTAKTPGSAGALLQERVETAAREAGAKTLSSRVNPGSEENAPNQIAYSGEFELDIAALQRLLYDLEAGAPLLLVDSLTIQAPRGAEGGGTALRVSLGLVGQWRAAP